MPLEVRHPHSERRQRASIRVEHQASNPEPARDEAGVLSACATEYDHAVRAHVMTTADRNLLNRCRHVLHGHAQEAMGNLRGRSFEAQCLQRGSDFSELLPRLLLVELKRKSVRGDASQMQGDVGQRELAPAGLPVAKRSRLGACALRADCHASSFELADRPASGRNGVELDHRRTYPNTADLAFEHPRDLAGVAGHVGGGSTHVEADHFRETELVGDCPCRHDARGRTGQHRVASDEAGCVDQSSVALHHSKTSSA